MNQRLVWNFELANMNAEPIPRNFHDRLESGHWELRYFWDQEQIISLSGLDEAFLDLERYSIKSRDEVYYLLPDLELNIKERQESLLYKPCLAVQGAARQYGKKIDLENSLKSSQLVGVVDLNVGQLLEKIQQQAQPVRIRKYSLKYSLQQDLKLSLELSRIELEGQIFFSVCLESKSLSALDYYAQRLQCNGRACHYLEFLKQAVA